MEMRKGNQGRVERISKYRNNIRYEIWKICSSLWKLLKFHDYDSTLLTSTFSPKTINTFTTRMLQNVGNPDWTMACAFSDFFVFESVDIEELTLVELNLLLVAYETVTEARWASWNVVYSVELEEDNKGSERVGMILMYRSNIESELDKIYNRLLKVLWSLIPVDIATQGLCLEFGKGVLAMEISSPFFSTQVTSPPDYGNDQFRSILHWPCMDPCPNGGKQGKKKICLY
ncbi:hypothetical protein IFM89_037198 [Coptis chinensis]|uniref:14-3-3 domain-containing protein n=1 Tax=Coptis chinensis TaxID=261450 RepID=A0A835HJF3_9MAGN|nr:hypothetical protein IFM89_037198 [Coptis chinensis]